MWSTAAKFDAVSGGVRSAAITAPKSELFTSVSVKVKPHKSVEPP
jgi:hypothetical protein